MIKCSRKAEQEVTVCAPKPTEVPNCPVQVTAPIPYSRLRLLPSTNCLPAPSECRCVRTVPTKNTPSFINIALMVLHFVLL